MSRFTAVAALLFFVGLLVTLAAPQNAFGLLRDVGLAGLLISLAYYSVRLMRRLVKRFLWKVRNKIILSYAFVGLIPVLILTFIGIISFRLVFGQVSALYLENEIRLTSVALQEASHRVASGFYARRQAGGPRQLLQATLQEREHLLQEEPAYAHLRAYVFLRSADGALRPAGRLPEEAPPLLLPEWAGEGFDGLVHDRGRLYFRSLEQMHQASDRLLLVLDLPFDEAVVEAIEQRTSLRLTPPQSVTPLKEARGLSVLFQGQGGWGDIFWMHVVTPVDWTTGSTMRFLDPELSLFAISVPLEQLYYNFYFSQETFLGQYLLQIVALLGIVFILAEAVSLFIGVAIARNITRSIQNIYSGTERIRRGEFGYSIPEGKADQLGALSAAFNSMSASIARLLSQLGEKERLEKELEIARQVQEQLFPRTIPKVRRLSLAGQCLPARMVSGDYYDFIPFDDQRLDIVIADISGKGISAALLMASLQSAIRTRVVYQSADGDFPVCGPGTLRRAVAALNTHLYAQTAADKFATLVFSHFDADSLTLTYCNAGHNPPLLFSNKGVRKLSAGGMAAGLFEDREYEEESLQLSQGDLVLFYTDGVVEAQDPQGRQFEMDRLVELVSGNVFLTADDIQKLVLDEVLAFSRGEAQHDDITVVVLKVE
ncbi:MAG TPA: SpoIIE family protein phosphatase [Acidobacteriota bacterium]|nr:SpoIIE family protein phosphatase [Acidobacteriota bacterium]